MLIEHFNLEWKMGRVGDRWYLHALQRKSWPGKPMPWQEQPVVLATVTRNNQTRQPTFNRWFVSIRGKAQEQAFLSKDEAVAWATAVVKLDIQ